MRLVAVMDLMAGQVVHARRGLRDAYQPLRSPLCDGGDPAALAQALLSLHCFEALYIADLDAILERGRNVDVIDRIRQAVPGAALWLDAGIADSARLHQAAALATPVIGTESLANIPLLDEAAALPSGYILSLDFKAGEFLGPTGLLASPWRWPRRVLAMNLDRVGASEGPDLELVARLARLKPDAQIFAAGGVRGRADLQAISDAGGAGALVATALHDGRLSAGDLKDWGQGKR